MPPPSDPPLSAFREKHLLEIASTYTLHLYSSSSPRSLREHVKEYMRQTRSLGSHDRRAIRQELFALWRHLPRLEALIMLEEPLEQQKEPASKPWALLLTYWQLQRTFLGEHDSFPAFFDALLQRQKQHSSLLSSLCPSLLASIEAALPLELFNRLLDDLQRANALDEKEARAQALSLCKAQLTAPTLDLRANALQMDPALLCDKLPKGWSPQRISSTHGGIAVAPAPKEQALVTQHPLYEKGAFELQDRASQQSIDFLKQMHDEQKINLEAIGAICDYCAGSGGKSLALASLLSFRGERAPVGGRNREWVLHDRRKSILLKAEKRAKRAGLKASYIHLGEQKPLPLFDLVIVDAPCSGSGTWKRQSELKQRVSPAEIDALIATNRQILEQAALRLRPGGYVLFITCSIFPSENELFIESICQNSRFKKLGARKIAPTPEQDGFFTALLQNCSLSPP